MSFVELYFCSQSGLFSWGAYFCFPRLFFLFLLAVQLGLDIKTWLGLGTEYGLA